MIRYNSMLSPIPLHKQGDICDTVGPGMFERVIMFCRGEGLKIYRSWKKKENNSVEYQYRVFGDD